MLPIPIHWGIQLLVLVVLILVGLQFLPRSFKPFSFRLGACVIPLVVAGVIALNAWQRYQSGQGGFKLGVDLVGGTILVYEVDVSKFPEGKLPDSYKREQLAASLKRRIDPADLYNVTIRPVSDTRVEIILPTGGTHQAEVEEAAWQELLDKVRHEYQDQSLNATRGNVQELITNVVEQHPNVDRKDVFAFIDKNYQESKQRRHLTGEEVQEVKEKISQVGSLEFRILANERDDKEAIEAAKKYFAEGQNDPAVKTEWNKRAQAGLPPPAPPPPTSEGFKVELKDKPYNYSYTWIELGRSERKALALDNAAENDPSRNAFWQKAKNARDKGEPLVIQDQETLLYSRQVVKVPLPEKERDKKYEYFLLTREPLNDEKVTGDYLTYAGEDAERGHRVVAFHFNTEGGNLFYNLTSRNAAPKGSDDSGFHRHLAIIMDKEIMSAPRLNEPIRDRGIIQGNFSKQEVDRLVTILRAGALPATLKPQPVSENTMGATLGADTIKKGTYSVAVAFIVILVFMIVYYRFAGLVASVALLANLLLTVAFMVAVQATFTLPGLAGLVLMLGMAVDANVLIYERLREERDRGASLALAIRNGYDRAFPTIIDTHLSSIFTAIVLYAVGNDQLKGFGVSLTVGLIISLFTSLYMTRLLFDIWLARGWLHKLSMFRLFSRPNINFMGIRYYWFTATILLTIIGISVFIWRLPQDLNIDFVGGTAYGGRLKTPMRIDNLRERLDEKNQKERLDVARVEEVPGEDSLAYDITYQGDQRPWTIYLPNRPEGATKEAREQEVRRRASQLPDVSVEQIFPSQETQFGNESRHFTIRTSEKAPELVQVSIGRLLEGVIETVQMKAAIDADDKGATLTFSGAEKPFASPGQVTALLQREFKKQGITERFGLKGEGEQGTGEQEGRYERLKLTLPQPVPREKLEKALAHVSQEFGQRPSYDRLENFDSQLAEETQIRAAEAILASWAAILLYLWFRFGSWTFGLAAVLCLIHDLFFTMGIIAFCHYLHGTWLGQALLIQDFKIDLPAVAALLTLVGYSVNDTIVVFDRIREVRGKNPELTPQMINDSVNQTLSRTLLTSFATWLVVIVLYVFGGEGVHLFAFCMVIGVIVGTYSSIYIASPLLLIFGEGKKPTSIRERQPQPAGLMA